MSKIVDLLPAIQLLTGISTFLLTVVGAWYACETRKLRISTNKQVILLKRQLVIAQIPYLVPGALGEDSNAIRMFYQDVKSRDEWVCDCDVSDDDINNGKFSYGVCIMPLTKHPAIDVATFLYDSIHRSWIISKIQRSVLFSNHKYYHIFGNEHRTTNEIILELKASYPLLEEKYLEELDNNKSAACVIYRDLLGSTHLLMRSFEVEGNTIRHRDCLYTSFEG